MTREQAIEMASAFRATQKFTDVRAEQFGGEFAKTSNPWQVLLWSINARAGNRNLTVVEDYRPKMVGAITRKALGKATARDQEAFRRIAAEREMNRS
jgi:hypothetical protein